MISAYTARNIRPQQYIYECHRSIDVLGAFNRSGRKFCDALNISMSKLLDYQNGPISIEGGYFRKSDNLSAIQKDAITSVKKARKIEGRVIQ